MSTREDIRRKAKESDIQVVDPRIESKPENVLRFTGYANRHRIDRSEGSCWVELPLDFFGKKVVVIRGADEERYFTLQKAYGGYWFVMGLVAGALLTGIGIAILRLMVEAPK